MLVILTWFAAAAMMLIRIYSRDHEKSGSRPGVVGQFVASRTWLAIYIGVLAIGLVSRFKR